MLAMAVFPEAVANDGLAFRSGKFKASANARRPRDQTTKKPTGYSQWASRFWRSGRDSNPRPPA
ncbi:protein of unknown function [Paraburkholderia kururiensis]